MGDKFVGSAYKHFWSWGVCSSLAVAVCTIVATTFVGNLVGPEGLAVTNLATPVFLLYSLFGGVIGVGANVYIGRFLGESDLPRANRAFRTQLGLGLIVGALCFLPLLFKDAFFSFLGVTEELYQLADQYITVIMFSAPVFVFYQILSVSVRTDSDPKFSAVASGVVITTNIALDILFMRVLEWGIIGASASLCIAELLGVLVLLAHFLKKRKLLKLRIALPRPKEAARFFANGFGVGSEAIFDAVVILVFNTFLLSFGGEAGTIYVAIYSLIYTVSMIPDAIFEGSSTALSTVTSFLVGEADTKGVFTVLKKALAAVIIGGGIFAILCAIFSESLVWFFGIRDAADLLEAATAMRIFAISVVFTGINTVFTAFWQSIGRAHFAGMMSVMRNFILMLVFGIFLISKANVVGLALAYILSEVLGLLIIIGVLALSSSKKYLTEKYGIKGNCFERVYEINTDSMAKISRDLDTLRKEWNISAEKSYFINFICEELILNIIKFGLADTNPKKKYHVSIKMMESDQSFVLRIRDNVSLYNPFESKGDEIDSGVLTLIQKKTKHCTYQRKMVFNYFYTVI